MNKVYVQTASFSHELHSDFHASLEKISKAGYCGLEMFDGIYGGYSSKELKDYLNSINLEVISAHIRMECLDEELSYLPDTGCKYLICPGLHIDSRDAAYKAARQLNLWGAASNAAGLRFGYHNHNNDFDVYEDQTVIDILIQNTDPKLVMFELDAAWSWRAGVNAADFIRRYSGRFELIHVKETSRMFGPQDNLKEIFAGIKHDANGRPIFSEEQKAIFEEHRKINCKLGDGIINMPEIEVAADAQGAQAYIVEREYGYTGDIFTSLSEDCAYLKAL